MRLRFKNNQRGIIPAILALIIGLVCIVILVLVLALIVYFNHIIAGLIGGGDQPGGFYGSGNCATTQTFNGINIPEGGKGKLVQEQHLATSAESFPGGWPTSSHDQDERHYQLTNFSVNCTGCEKEGFTPPEGGGSAGQGTGEKPPINAEPWIMNMRANFPRGTKMIITSAKTGKTVVAAGGYEYGPSSHEFIGGAQPEVLNALGILNGDRTVTIGFAQDQNLPFGPISCAAPGGVSGSGPCGQNLVNIAINEIGREEKKPCGHKLRNCVKYNRYSGEAWCDTFVNWVYSQAGFDYMYKNCFQYLVCSQDYFRKNQTFIDVRNGDTSQIRPGDYFWLRREKNNSHWHAGLVEYVSGNEIHTIEGNVGSGIVARRTQRAGNADDEIWYVGRLKSCGL